MAKVIGIQASSFQAKDGTVITGKILYLTSPINPKFGEGEFSHHVFISSKRCESLEAHPKIGMNVKILYNNYRKFEEFRELPDDEDPEIDL